MKYEGYIREELGSRQYFGVSFDYSPGDVIISGRKYGYEFSFRVCYSFIQNIKTCNLIIEEIEYEWFNRIKKKLSKNYKAPRSYPYEES